MEYNKIIAMLADKADSEPGKKLCLELLPSTDIAEIRKSQLQTGDALKGELPLAATATLVFPLNPWK